MSRLRIGTICHVGHGRLGYIRRLHSGRWLRESNRIEGFIVARWNRLVCTLVGHERTLEGITEIYDEHGRFPCTACSRRLRPHAGVPQEGAHP